MERLDLEPTEDVLLESIKVDCVGRNQDAIDLIKMLADTKGPYSYMIDAPWGDGKTFFVKSVIMILESMNSVDVSEEDCAPELERIENALRDTDVSMLPFYFNAWSNDFADDPVTALFASMAAEFDRSDYLRESRFAKGLVSIVDAGLALAQIPVRVSGVVEALTGESLVDAYRKRAEIRSRISDLCGEALEEVANKLVIFIDELDRCRPDFAVRLLEQTKSLFASDNVVLVFAADSSQLAKAVGGMYGPGFETQRFLGRFFDKRVMMSPVDGYAVSHGGDPMPSSGRFDNLVAEEFASKVFTIRDHLRIKEDIDRARECCFDCTYRELSYQVAVCAILPLMVFIKHEDIDLFRNIVSGSSLNAVYEYGSLYSSFGSIVRDAINSTRCNTPYGEEPSCTEKDCSAYMHDLCMVIYGSKAVEYNYSEMRRRLGSFDADRFDEKVFKQLKFD